MDLTRRIRLSGLPLALQIMGLLLGVLVIAQLVTLFLTLVLPPEPPPQYSMADIARALSGSVIDRGDARPLQRLVRSGPPPLSGPGWMMPDRSRHELAQLLQRDDADVQLYFYTPLPFAGTTLAPPTMPGRAVEYRIAPERFAAGGIRLLSIRFAEQDGRGTDGVMPVDLQLAQATPGPGGPPGGGFPGGFPGGGFPGGGSFPGTHTPPVTPTGNLPRAPMPGHGTPGSQPPSLNTPPQTPATPPAATAPVEQHAPFNPVPPGQPAANFAPQGGSPIPSANPVILRAPMPAIPAPILTPVIPAVPSHPFPDAPATMAPSQDAMPHPATRIVKPRAEIAPLPEPGIVAPTIPESAPAPAPSAPMAKPLPSSPSFLVPTPPPPRGLFGLAPAPFVEGDFIAALKISDTQWVVVQPQPESFPNTWQRRVLLWFLISFALVAPLGLLFARRLVRPIAGFAIAAERLGRDPRAPVLAMEGPAEVGRAAHAFNRMQNRLRSFVDDRTAMIGAISHDLRTPLTRLRFRLEDVPEPLQAGMLAEVNEMEEMIKSVLGFIRDASEPGARERMDLRAIVEDVVEDAVFIGRNVTLEDSEQAPVDVDPLGMRRLFGNLLENAVKYGDRAHIRLFTDKQDAVAEVRDNGPGLAEEELEQVFQPFYRTPAARASKAQGSGLGLAVCRSIARAHGGDVQLMRGERGLVAQVRLPLAYGMAQS